MKIAYQYRLRPTINQSAQMETWLELLRRQYNYRLAERFNWWEQNRCDIDRCSIISSSIAPPADRPEFYGQKRDLVNTKRILPEYTGVYSQVLQNCIERVRNTFDRFISGDSNGKRSGKPRFKAKGRYRSFTYPALKQDCIQGKFITLPKIGNVKIILHRPIPDGFKIKTATIVYKADGWYITLSLQDDTVPSIVPDIKLENTVGIDVGLKDFLVTSDGEKASVPRFARKSEKRRQLLNKALSRKKKGSRRRQKAVRRLSKHYQKVARQRRDFHFKTAKWLLDKYDVIAYEDLNIKGLAKTRLSKSILDAGWGEFIAIVAVNAGSAGRLAIAVNPNGTTQRCSGCDELVPKALADRWHSCPHCLLELDRDINAAINIKKLALGHRVNKARGDRSSRRSVKREAHAISLVG